jgi:hypothetical protein
MAEMLFIPKNGTHQFGCYSERGLMSYFMFVQLPKRLPEFLESLQFPKDVPNPFANLNEPIKKSIIFSELSLGNEGFGVPDGAIYVEWPEPTMIFVEVKANDTFAESFKNESFNSTLTGQLELKWRFVSSYSSERESALNKMEYVHEDKVLKEFYTLDNEPCDEFYRAEGRRDEKLVGSWRRLLINNGVKDFLGILNRTEGRVVFLAITADRTNPFHKPETKLPRCYGKEWSEAKRQFCWLSIDELKRQVRDV